MQDTNIIFPEQRNFTAGAFRVLPKIQQLSLLSSCPSTDHSPTLCHPSHFCQMKSFYVAIALCVLMVASAQNKFNAFKNYRNEKVKPPHYGSREVIRHPIHEYLSEPQKRMMKHRKSSSHHPDAVYKENWSGFDKPNRKLTGIISHDNLPQQQDIEIDSSDYLRWLCLILVGGSVGWTFYMLIHRQTTSPKTGSNPNFPTSEDIEAACVPEI